VLGAASAEAEAKAREESARGARVDVAFPFNPAGARRVRGRSRAATGRSPDEDARDPRAVALVDAGASRAAEAAAENAIVGSARPARGAASPGNLDEKKMPRASGQTSERPVEGRGGVGAGARTRTREVRAAVSRRGAFGTLHRRFRSRRGACSGRGESLAILDEGLFVNIRAYLAQARAEYLLSTTRSRRSNEIFAFA
jgi:hypothetical protein